VPRRAAITAALIVALAVLGLGAPAASAVPVARLSVAFDRGAVLGATTALHAELALDPRRAPSPLVSARLLYPQSLGILLGGLGLASCRRPATEFAQIILESPLRCPPNAVLGYGTAVAQVRLNDGQAIPEYAAVTVLAGPIVRETVELVAYIEGLHPFGARLLYSGALATGAPPFGGALAVETPVIPSLVGFATVSLLDMKLVIGSPAITYYEHTRHGTVAYHPDGIQLPQRCPRGGFPFRLRLGFQDGSVATAATTARCPRRTRT
jgi:hypothetical protein